MLPEDFPVRLWYPEDLCVCSRRMPQPGAALTHCTKLQIRGRHRATN
jgi:hypothetical protein